MEETPKKTGQEKPTLVLASPCTYWQKTLQVTGQEVVDTLVRDDLLYSSRLQLQALHDKVQWQKTDLTLGKPPAAEELKTLVEQCSRCVQAALTKVRRDQKKSRPAGSTTARPSKRLRD